MSVNYLYLRYIDDILVGHSKEVSTTEIADLFNSFHSKVTVSHEPEDEQCGIAFLDVSIHTKVTAQGAALSSSSRHVPSIHTSWPLSRMYGAAPHH